MDGMGRMDAVSLFILVFAALLAAWVVWTVRRGRRPVADVQHRRPSIATLTRADSPDRGPPAFIRAPAAGTLLRIAIGWMMCQHRHPPAPPPSCPLRKTAMPSPRRQHPVYQGSLHPAGPPPVRLRSSRPQPSGFATSLDPIRAEAMRRDGRSRTGWSPREARRPWQIGCSRRGDGIADCSTSTMVARRDGNPRVHRST